MSRHPLLVASPTSDVESFRIEPGGAENQSRAWFAAGTFVVLLTTIRPNTSPSPVGLWL